MSALPIKPFNHNYVRGYRMTANFQNRDKVIKLNKDPDALEGVRQEMKKLRDLGFIKKSPHVEVGGHYLQNLCYNQPFPQY